MLEKPDGKKSVKVDALPVGPGWDGWLVISERRKGGGRIRLRVGRRKCRFR